MANAAAYAVGHQKAIGSIADLAFAGTLVALIPAHAKAPEEEAAWRDDVT